jgi:hypothetical protein
MSGKEDAIFAEKILDINKLWENADSTWPDFA